MKGASQRRSTVCFVAPSLAGGGAERVAVQVLNALDDTRWDRCLYLFERRGPYLADLSASIRVEASNAASRIGQWRQLRRFLRDRRPDVVVAFLSYVSVLTAARAARVGSRVVFDVQTPVSAFLTDADYRWSRPLPRRVFASAMRRACAAADLLMAASTGVADDLVQTYGAPPANVRVVPNSVDVDTISRATNEPLEDAVAERWMHPVIVTAGRLADVKNYPLLLAAFAILRETIPATLFILGTGAQELAVRAEIRARRLDAVVHLCGFQRNPWKFIARADVFALTSRYEGFGNVLIESMACGVPVVATSSPGTRDIVTDGVDGLLVERHEPAAIAAALAKILGQPPLREQLATAARQKAQCYGAESVARAYDRALSGTMA